MEAYKNMWGVEMRISSVLVVGGLVMTLFYLLVGSVMYLIEHPEEIPNFIGGSFSVFVIGLLWNEYESPLGTKRLFRSDFGIL